MGEGLTTYNTRGLFGSMLPAYAGAASEGSGFEGRGVLAFTRGIAGGFGGWEGQEYTGPYGDVNDEYPHAVTARSNGDTFTYNASPRGSGGNMTSRTQSGVTWTQVFDAENHLVSIGNGTSTTTYVYDGSGGRLKRIVNDGATVTTTLYIGNMEIEKVGSTETKRTVYYGGAFRVIVGENPGLYFLHSDYLGSTSVISDANGLKVAGSDVVYAPFGEVRAGNESDLTDFGYTGQRHDDSSGGLMYYGARYYLPGIQHFISADTIVPGPANPQAFNRYSYVFNNPVMLVDLTVTEVADVDFGAILWKFSPAATYWEGKASYYLEQDIVDTVSLFMPNLCLHEIINTYGEPDYLLSLEAYKSLGVVNLLWESHGFTFQVETHSPGTPITANTCSGTLIQFPIGTPFQKIPSMYLMGDIDNATIPWAGYGSYAE